MYSAKKILINKHINISSQVILKPVLVGACWALRSQRSLCVSHAEEVPNAYPGREERSFPLLLQHCKLNSLKEHKSGVPLRCSGLRIWHCHCSGPGCCCGVVSIPGLGTPTCHGRGQTTQIYDLTVLEIRGWKRVSKYPQNCGPPPEAPEENPLPCRFQPLEASSPHAGLMATSAIFKASGRASSDLSLTRTVLPTSSTFKGLP